MNLQIKEQTVLITGAGRGLGSEIAKSFHREGAKVVINYRKSFKSAQKLSASLGENVILIQGDIREKDQVSKMHDELHNKDIKVDTVVHNAINDFVFNGDQRKKIDTIEWQDFQNQIETSQKGFLNLLNIFNPNMKKNSFGRFISIGTNLFQNPVIPYHDYTAAKGGLLSLTRTAAIDLGQFNITVNMVSGGLLKVTDASKGTPDSVFEYISSITPLRKVTTTEDFSDAVLFFASPWSRAVTGQNLVVDGGLVLN
ncbi:Putative dehydrogenase [Prochlorococcus marinus str. MIT 9515]|uniref:Putative dehydrogenase n=1 Tax=Prochlorococcus marinus (strain MIT 9515) TaxID=167542 RepID=A2BV19_PROM5|nr:3-oxoacyl-ACP reductase [Prochlorococcus marinus]ABM71630.1 Putative dehydrogenase [Prochlorococcus marinus str. MIT 9515]